MHPTIPRAVLALALCIGTAACAGDNPAALPAPGDAQFNTGVTFGSGGRASTTSETENTTAADSGSTARGGVTFGSGG